MSELSIFVDQILRPSFLPNLCPPTRRTSQPVAAAKRAAVRECLRRAGRPVSRMWVEDYTGYTKQSVNHILQSLCEAGEVRRVEGGAVLLWEGV